jgi:signal transduction histidine kinase
MLNTFLTKLLFFGCLVFSTLPLFGQHAYIDSIELRLKHEENLTERLDLTFKLAKSYRNVNSFTGLKYADSALLMAEQLGNKSFEAQIINETGVLYRKSGLFIEALAEHQQALTIFEQLDDQMGVAFALANIGNVYFSLEQYQKALDYNLQSLTIKRQLGDERQITYSLRTTALAYKALQQYKQADTLLKEALASAIGLGNNFEMGNLYYHLGNVSSLANQDKQQALVYYEKALKLYNSVENQYGTAIANFEKAKAHLDMEQYDVALALLEKALAISTKNNSQKITMNIYKAFSQLFEKQGDHVASLAHFKNYSQLHDKLFTEMSNRNIAEMQAKYDIKRQQAQIKILEKEQMLNATNRLFYIFALIFISALVILVYLRFREKQRTNKKLRQEIKQRKHQEEKLRYSEKKLKAANATKDKFFSIISHDLKSPFNAILGLSELLDSDYDQFTETKRRQIIHEINKATNNTFSLLQDLLAWSQSQQGQIDYCPEKLILSDVCKANADFTLPVSLKKDIVVRCDVPPDLQVFADKNMLTTIIRNLLSNAIKFTPHNGEILILSQGAKNPAAYENPFVDILVKDNGIGISKEDQAKLFSLEDKFKSKGTDQESGTGLGLIICKEFVEKHGGSFRVISEPGKGSSFIFSLPMAKD